MAIFNSYVSLPEGTNNDDIKPCFTIVHHMNHIEPPTEIINPFWNQPIIINTLSSRHDYQHIQVWLVVSTPLKNDGVRQLGSWHSQLNGKS